ncbi:LolA family protein [Holophaga foetida]|uniref:LolA family protein n=1 Tax=Holophaga foetida TaxID=35839 RepID=UPI0002471C9E|nr:outer membrane lipoprotein carrier protein LolA [Holophaga foetida]
MRRLALVVLAAPLAAQTADALTAHLRNTPLLHADFTQTRHLKALTRPLVARGTVVVDRQRGIIWQVLRPLNLTYVVTPQGVLEVGPDGRRKTQTTKDAPMVAQMGRIMQALAEGRWSVLEDYFTLKAQGTPGRWEIRLSPKPVAASFIKSVVVKGGRVLERFQIEEPGGDHSEVVFGAPRLDQPLSEAEARLLNLK